MLAVEGETLTVRTRTGVTKAHARTVYRSREEGEAAIAKKPSPNPSSKPMTHYGPDEGKR